MSRTEQIWPITLAQLSALSEFITVVDRPPYNEACSAAHQIIMEILGPDEALCYAPSDESEEVAA